MLHRKWPLAAILVLAWWAQGAHSQTIFKNGFEASCLVDSDGDRLFDCEEFNIGTDPDDEDTDRDGLRDGDEVLGTIDGLDLPGMGTDPRHKDILLEHDWVTDQVGCGGHSHKPTVVALQQITAEFAASPVWNPDGSSGINVLHDYGQGGAFTGGNQINTMPDGTVQGAVAGGDFVNYKILNHEARRIGFFHYVLHAHRYTQFAGSTGQAEIVGDDVIVSMQCGMGTDDGRWARNTIMHELGHNLGLRHGGSTNCNYKPNYNSIMNYLFQLDGVDTDCNMTPNAQMHYSPGANAPLDETALNEPAGICGTTPVDWNGGGISQAPVSFDINPYAQEIMECGANLQTLTDSDDWANVLLSVMPNAPGGGQTIPEVASCMDLP